MAKKMWCEIYGQGPTDSKPELLAKVRSPGLACSIAEWLRQTYANVTVK